MNEGLIVLFGPILFLLTVLLILTHFSLKLLDEDQEAEATT